LFRTHHPRFQIIVEAKGVSVVVGGVIGLCCCCLYVFSPVCFSFLSVHCIRRLICGFGGCFDLKEAFMVSLFMLCMMLGLIHVTMSNVICILQVGFYRHLSSLVVGYVKCLLSWFDFFLALCGFEPWISGVFLGCRRYHHSIA
jgi:hypothetical protein